MALELKGPANGDPGKRDGTRGPCSVAQRQGDSGSESGGRSGRQLRQRDPWVKPPQLTPAGYPSPFRQGRPVTSNPWIRVGLERPASRQEEQAFARDEAAVPL